MNIPPELATTAILKYMLCMLGATLLMLSPPLFAAGDVLLNEDAVASRLGQGRDYQLLDARSAEAQRSAPLAFSTRYDKTVAIRKGLVFVVADDDAAAQEIAQSIPAAGERVVFAVKGGAAAWKRVQSKSARVVAPSFVVPKGTCELGAPSLKFAAPPGKKAGKPALESINK